MWEVILLLHRYQDVLAATAKHLTWPEAKVQAAVNYAGAFPDEIEGALAENRATGFTELKRMLLQAVEWTAGKPAKH